MVNVALSCSIVLFIIVLLGKAHVVQVSSSDAQSEDNEELDPPVGEIDTPSSLLIWNEPEEQCGRLDDSRNGE